MPSSVAYTKTTTYSSVQGDAFSFSGNQASLASYKHLSAGIYGERRFMLAELGLYQFAFALPTSSGNFGLQSGYFGSSSYNQTQVGLAYARSLGKMDVGTQFNYHQVRIQDYGNASAVNFDLGMILHISDQFQTGVHIHNPTKAGLGSGNEEKIPIIFSFGLGYDASEKLFIGTEIEKVEDQSVNINAGLQYSFDAQLFARAGISFANSVFYFGAGFLWSDFTINISASVHPTLGVTPGLLLLYSSSNRK